MVDIVLDLYNFDSVDAEGSRYVLTSPRSLEACSRLNIKPVQLLPKSLDDFYDENAGKSVEFIKIMYKDWDDKRNQKLTKCRRERERIIMEKKVKERTKKISNETTEKPINGKHASTIPKVNKSSRPAIKTQSLFEKPNSLAKKKELNQNLSIPSINGDMQVNGSKETTLNQLQLPVNRTNQYFSNLDTPRSDRSRNSVNEYHQDKRSRSKSEEPRYNKIFGPSISLRSSSVFSQASSRLPSGYITPQIQRDKKLVEVMKEKRRKDKMEERERQKKVIDWSLEKKQIEKIKKREELLRQKELAVSHMDWEKKVREGEEKRKKQLKRMEEERLKQQEIADALTQTNKEKQEKMRQQQIEDRKKAAHERKTQQEKSLHAVNEEALAFQEATNHDIQERLRKAEKVKLENEIRELEKVKLMNKKQKERFQEVSKEVKRRNEIEDKLKQELLEEKLARAEENYTKKIIERDVTYKNQGKEIQLKTKQTQENQKRLDKETEEKMKLLAEHKSKLLERASITALKNKHEKSTRVQKMRVSQEEGWKRNLTFIQERDEEAIRKTMEDLELKENQTKRHLQLKEAAFEFSRVHAKINEAERDIVKRETTNFHQMDQHAKLISKIGRGPRSSFVNYSTVKLG